MKILVCLMVLVCVGCSGAQRRGQVEQEHAADVDLYALHRGIGIALLATEQPARALPHFRWLGRMRPDVAEPYYLLARVYMVLRLHALAEEHLEQALEVDPLHPGANAMLGVLLDVTERHERAFEAHLRATELAPSHGPYHNNLGFNLYLRDRPAEAVRAYQRALAFEPGSARIHNNMAFAYGELGNLRQAWEHFLRGGTVAAAKNNLGLVHERRGDHDRAASLYLAALDDDPTLEEARANLARTRDLLSAPVGDTSEGAR